MTMRSWLERNHHAVAVVADRTWRAEARRRISEYDLYFLALFMHALAALKRNLDALPAPRYERGADFKICFRGGIGYHTANRPIPVVWGAHRCRGDVACFKRAKYDGYRAIRGVV